ncbi:MAG: ketoacyl-ACP synthase III [Chitinophagales bacterium]
MALFSLPNVKVSGLAVAVPKCIEDNADFAVLPEQERDLFIKTVGIRYRRIADKDTTASDLCFAAADKLLNDLKWNRSEVSVLIFISQTPDYLIPNTSSLLQEKLGLPKSCMVFDVNLGCSGYTYGLSIISGLLQNIPGAKGLLLVGDISTATVSQQDKSTAPIFSDAGSATALEFSLNHTMHFNLQTDGKEYDDIIIPDGGYRNPYSSASSEMVDYGKGIVRSKLHMKLDGLKIFNFALREVAPNINALLGNIKKDKADINYVVFHQANLLMLESVRKKLQIEAEKVPYSLYDYGNTGSATIPLTLLVKLRSELTNAKLNLILCGFGVGLSWGSVYLETENLVCPELIEV